jgi:hypothetical protein
MPLAIDIPAQKFSPDEYGEFLDVVESANLEVEEDEDGYNVYLPASGRLVGRFSTTPDSGVPGGWYNYTATL